MTYGLRNTKYDGALTAITKKPFYAMSFEYTVTILFRITKMKMRFILPIAFPTPTLR